MSTFRKATLRLASKHPGFRAALRAEIGKKADSELENVPDPELVKQVEKDVRRIMSQTSLSRLRKAFGPLGVPFFQFYQDLRRLRKGIPLQYPDLWEELRKRSRLLMRSGLSSPVANSVQEALNEVKPWVRAVGRDPESSPSNWRKIVGVLAPLMVRVAKDKGVYLKSRMFGPERWSAFQVMRKNEASLERIRDTDPALYELISKYQGQISEIDTKIKERVERAGLDYKRRFMFGRAVHIGVDPFTGEELVYDRLEPVPVPVDEYVEARRQDNAQLARQSRVFPASRQLEQMRQVSEEAIDQLETPLEYASLTDDKAKQGGLTRIYPVKEAPDGRKIIVGGRFKGFYLDAMVNSAGRMIEGTAYNYDPKTGRVAPIELRASRGGHPVVRTTREPYTTVTEVHGKQKCFLKIPGMRAYTEVRSALRKLSKVVPSVEYVDGTRNSEFMFDPKDFEAVREALGGMAMSEAASKLIREYFEELALAELATAEENLSHYELEALGGFKTNRIRENPLLTKQKQALAWMEARGNNGVCALDTGVGKTLVSVAMMQKLKRDGFWEEDTEEPNNGRYLYVCPKALKGNIIKTVRGWLQEEAARELIDRLDIMTYRQFGNARRQDKEFGESYIAIFFDEAQELKNIGGVRSTTRQALSLNHPRKILLTASPLEKQPSETYVLAAVSNNLDLGDPERGKDLRRDMRKFQARFAETVGGRVVGVKDDPLIRREMKTWVKKNIFFAEKTDVEEFTLPDLSRSTVVVTMPPEVEEAYREEIKGIRGALRGMVALYRDQGRDTETGRILQETRDKKISQLFTPKLARLLKRLFILSNNPREIVPTVAQRTPDGRPVVDPVTGEPRLMPTPNPKLNEALRITSLDHAARDGRTLMFTDDPDFVVEAAREMSLRMPGLYHLAAGARRIDVFQDGRPLTEYEGFKMPFREKQYKRFPNEPASNNNPAYRKAEWQTFVLRELVRPNPRFVTATLQGQIYQVGQNLQTFTQVIHLDRDTWNSEDMKQRTARAWRQGQRNSVKEFTIDMVYENPSDEFDRTLDEIRKYVQDLDEEMFNRIIKDAQVLALGQEYFDMRRTLAKYYDVDRKSLELSLSPYLEQSDVPGEA